LDEFIQLFDITQITSQAPRFDLKKLDWVNSQYIRAKSDQELVDALIAFDEKIGAFDTGLLLKIMPLIKERMRTLSDFWFLAGFFFAVPTEFEKSVDQAVRTQLIDALEASAWDHESMEKAVRAAADSSGAKARDLFMDLRIAVTGKTIGPPLLEALEVLGKEETMNRLAK
jgi:glutamyl/glutaminyl-tRNA synthetase